MSNKALIIQPDHTVLLETNHPDFPALRSQLSKFADLIKTPPYLHTYRLTPISLWNAASIGMKAEEVIECLQNNCKLGTRGIPAAVIQFIRSCVDKFHLFRLEQVHDQLWLRCNQEAMMTRILQYPSVKKLLSKRVDHSTWVIEPANRGILKQEFIRLGYPILDVAGYQEGESFPIRVKDTMGNGSRFQLRDYQERAVEAFYQQGSIQGGSGLLVLPCGAGKTIVGIGIMARLNCEVLILTSNGTSVKQWRREILDKTDVNEEHIGEYTGSQKLVRPITIATYQILTYRQSKDAGFEHMQLFKQRNWGLIIYDEVHLLPAPVFRATAEIQAKRRLGLTATLIREDGLQEDVFSLVGPKKFDIPWKELEQKGWLATVTCSEIRVPMEAERKQRYDQATAREKFRIACENPCKEDGIAALLEKHHGSSILIIGQYLDQLNRIASRFSLPVITGKTPEKARLQLYEQFRIGHIKGLVVSKVGNFALDLPDAAVLVQVSGSFGSRQEEAQRLGRILRPKKIENKAYFYSLVTKETVEQDFSLKRQLFLVEQGYQYEILEADGLPSLLSRGDESGMPGDSESYAAGH